MHGRGKMAAAPASNAVTRGGRRCLGVELRPVFFFFFISGFAPTHADSAPTGADSAPTGADLRRFGPIRIVSAEYRCVSAGKRKSAGEKKKIYLKAKIPVDLMRRCRHIHWP